MIEQQGRVVRVEGGRAWVRVGSTSGCSACDAGRGCGAGLFGRLLKRRPVELSLSNPDSLPVGQAVAVGVSEAVFLRLVFGLYAWPLLAGLAGALAGHQLSAYFGPERGLQDLLTLAGLMLGAAIVLRRRGLAPEGLERSDVRLLGPLPGEGCRPGRENQ